MDIYTLNKIIEDEKPIQAPSGFTQGVMRKVLAMDQSMSEIKSSSSKIKYLQWGISCLSAGLIVLFLNLYPLLQPIDPFDSSDWKPMTGSIDSFSQAIDRLVISTEHIIINPWNNLTDIFRKEN